MSTHLWWYLASKLGLLVYAGYQLSAAIKALAKLGGSERTTYLFGRMAAELRPFAIPGLVLSYVAQTAMGADPWDLRRLATFGWGLLMCWWTLKNDDDDDDRWRRRLREARKKVEATAAGRLAVVDA